MASGLSRRIWRVNFIGKCRITALLAGPVWCILKTVHRLAPKGVRRDGFGHSGGFQVDDETLFNELGALAGKLGIAIRYGHIGGEDALHRGGLCRVEGKYFLIMHSRLTRKEKIRVMAETLRGFEIEDVYLKPVIRELLDKSG